MVRVLVVPEIYKRNYLSANGNLKDVLSWIDDWIERDPTTHVYLMLPRRKDVEWDIDVFENSPNVTVIATRRFLHGTKWGSFMSFGSWREEQLKQLDETISGNLGYVDAIIDQQPTGNVEIFKFWNENCDFRYAKVKPFDYIRCIHDLRVPYKAHGSLYRNDFDLLGEMLSTAYADGTWFQAGIDYDEFVQYGKKHFQFALLDEVRDNAIHSLAPIEFEKYDEQYNDAPKYVHVAGSILPKKNRKAVFETCEFLHQRYDIETIVTSMATVEDWWHGAEFAEVHEKCPYDTYQSALARGDLVISATSHETMGRTIFEQAASGQVLVAWSRPWLYDQVPEDYKFATDSKNALKKVAAWVIQNWDQAVRENRRMVAHAREVRDKPVVGKKTYDDLARRVEERVDEYEFHWDEDVLTQAIGYIGDDEFGLDEINSATRHFTESGKPILDNHFYPLSDLALALRKLGYEDTGTTLTPTFRPAR